MVRLAFHLFSWRIPPQTQLGWSFDCATPNFGSWWRVALTFALSLKGDAR